MPHQEHPEYGLHELLEPHDRFGRWLAVAIVATTLAGALVAFLQARSVHQHDEAGSRSEQWAALGSSVRGRSERAARLQIARARMAHRDRVRAEQADGRRIFAPDGDERALAGEARVWRKLAAQVSRTSNDLAGSLSAEFAEIDRHAAAALPNIDARRDREMACKKRRSGAPRAPPALPAGSDPDTDPTLVQRYLAESRRESYRFDALRQGATHEAEAAEKQFTRYAVSLAMFAVGVFLFGYALTPFGRRYRRLYAAAGTVFAVGSALWAGYAFTHGPHEPSPQAATAYADGRVAAERGDYTAAIRALDCAIGLNEDFPAAYLARGEAYNLLGSPQREDLIYSEGLVDPEHLAQAHEDAEHAGELMADDPTLVIALATELFVRGLTDHNRGDLERALELHRRSREMLPDLPLASFNVGTTQLALGRPWRRAYDEGETLMGEYWPHFVAAALTDLEAVKARRPEARRSVAAAKDDVVAAASATSLTAGGWPRDGTATPPARGLRDVELLVTGGAMEVNFGGTPGFAPRRDRIFAAVYRKTSRGWAAQPSYSGPLEGIVADARSHWFADIAPLMPPTACLRGGRYRVELYVDGRLAAGGSAEATAALPPLEHELLPDINIDLCHPPGWRRAAHRLTGIADGFTSPDGEAGVIVFDVTAAADAGVGVDRRLELARTRFRRMLPALGTRFGERTRGYLMGLADGEWTWYRYPGGALLMATGTSKGERSLAVAIFGPLKTFDEGRADERFSATDLLLTLTSRDVML